MKSSRAPVTVPHRRRLLGGALLVVLLTIGVAAAWYFWGPPRDTETGRWVASPYPPPEREPLVPTPPAPGRDSHAATVPSRPVPPRPRRSARAPAARPPAPSPSSHAKTTPPEPRSPAGLPATFFPNQPAGFTRIVEHGFGSRPLQASAAAGAWEEPKSANYAVVTTPTPTGDDRALQITWPKGLEAGSSPGKFHTWSSLDHYHAPRYGKLYISIRAMIPGRAFENQLVATKLFYFAYGNTAQTNDGGLTLDNGTGRQALMRAMALRPFISPGDDRARVGSRNLSQNVNRNRLFSVGSWHQIEMLLDVGAPNRANGAVTAWLDGALVLKYRDVQFLSTDFDFVQGFFDLQIAPVWGGRGGVRTRDDRLLIDHLYVSGVPQASPIATRSRER